MARKQKGFDGVKQKGFDAVKEVKAIARERVGRVPAAQAIEPKTSRKKPKHKKRQDEEQS